MRKKILIRLLKRVGLLVVHGVEALLQGMLSFSMAILKNRMPTTDLVLNGV